MAGLRERLGRRTVVLAGVGVLVLVAGVVAAVVAVPKIQERRTEANLKSVVADVHKPAARSWTPYPYGIHDMTLTQSGNTVTIETQGSVVSTVDLADGNEVVDWTTPPYSRPGWPFVFCIEHDDREWAMYHSSDGVVRKTGTNGNCAVPDIPGVNARMRCPTPKWNAREREHGRSRVNIFWGFPNPNDDNYMRSVEVYDGTRMVTRLDPWHVRQTLARFPTTAGYHEDLVFVATNGKRRYDSVDCPVTSINVPDA